MSGKRQRVAAIDVATEASSKLANSLPTDVIANIYTFLPLIIKAKDTTSIFTTIKFGIASPPMYINKLYQSAMDKLLIPRTTEQEETKRSDDDIKRTFTTTTCPHLVDTMRPRFKWTLDLIRYVNISRMSGLEINALHVYLHQKGFYIGTLVLKACKPAVFEHVKQLILPRFGQSLYYHNNLPRTTYPVCIINYGLPNYQRTVNNIPFFHDQRYEPGPCLNETLERIVIHHCDYNSCDSSMCFDCSRSAEFVTMSFYRKQPSFFSSGSIPSPENPEVLKVLKEKGITHPENSNWWDHCLPRLKSIVVSQGCYYMNGWFPERQRPGLDLVVNETNKSGEIPFQVLNDSILHTCAPIHDDDADGEVDLHDNTCDRKVAPRMKCSNHGDCVIHKTYLCDRHDYDQLDTIRSTCRICSAPSHLECLTTIHIPNTLDLDCINSYHETVILAHPTCIDNNKDNYNNIVFIKCTTLYCKSMRCRHHPRAWRDPDRKYCNGCFAVRAFLV